VKNGWLNLVANIIPGLSVAVSVFSLLVTLHIANQNRKLKESMQEIIEINNNIVNNEFYKKLYDDLYDIYKIYQDGAFAVGEKFESLGSDYNDFGPWSSFEDNALHSKEEFEGLGLDYESFSKVMKKLNKLRYCLPNSIIDQLNQIEIETRQKLFDMNEQESIFGENVVNSWRLEYSYDKDKKLLKKIEELLQLLAAKKYY
jgi:Txe/YoeB family toxin of Txe-Axe toxin-antitoxin module